MRGRVQRRPPAGTHEGTARAMLNITDDTASRPRAAAYLLPGGSPAVDRNGQVGEKTSDATLAQSVEQLIRNQ